MSQQPLGTKLSGLEGLARKSQQDLVFTVTRVHLETTHNGASHLFDTHDAPLGQSQGY